MSCVSNIIGEDIVQEIAQERMSTKTSLTMGISQDDLKAIHVDIAATIRPCWHAAPPANLGQVSHGKLKADESHKNDHSGFQYRSSLLTVENLVSLVKMCPFSQKG